jgi:ribosomal protein S18 acetylase RimI-like enzyme
MISAASLPSEVSERYSIPADSIGIEPVGSHHVQLLSELFERNRTSMVSNTFDPFPLDSEQARRIALEPRVDAYFVVHDDVELIAMSMLRGFDEGFTVPSFGIFVDHDHQGQGVGRQLTAWTVREARHSGYPAVRLSVYASNPAAVHLYQSLGFEERERVSVERAGGQDEKIVMLLELGR